MAEQHEKALVPQIRFTGFTDPWEQRKLGEVASGFEYGLNAAASDFDGEKKYLRITDIDDQTREFRTDDLSSPDINNPIDDRYLLKEGDILFARTGASVGKTYLYKASDGKTYYAGFLIRAHVSDEADAGFIFQSTLTERYKQFVLLTSQRSGQPGINAQEYSDLLLPLPSLMEQRRIGAFFDHLDSLITLHQRKYDKLCVLKKSMLDKMFPKGGSLYPEIRFAGFTDPWEQRKVQDVADRFDNLRIPVAANLRVHGKTPYYGANGIQDYVDGFTHDGEFVLVAEDGANDLKNYPVKCVNGRIWVNNHAHVLQGKAGIADNSFLAFAISQSDIESLLVGGGRAKLNAETLMSIEFRLPCLQEQHQIGEYLTRLDHLITLHQRKLELLRNIKKSMLDKMFV